METKANFALIGAFTLVGFLGILGFLMWFAKLELNRQFAYYDAYFREVAGLTVSSQVQFAGLNVGRVVATELSPTGAEAVRVRLELDEDTPVRVDSTASIDTSAVTGVSIVTITPGSPDAALLRDVTEEQIPVITSGRSTLQTLGQQAPELLARLNVLAGQLTQMTGDENQQRIANILSNTEAASASLDQTMKDVSRATDAIAAAATDLADVGDKLELITARADTALESFAGASTQAEQTLARVDAYLGDDLSPLTNDLRGRVPALADDLSRLSNRAMDSLDNLDVALGSATTTLDTAGRVVDDLGPVFNDLRSTLGRVNESLANLPDELPRITANIGDAARSAAGAFDSLRAMLDGARAPVQAFTREGLPQYSRLAQDMRAMVTNIDALVSTLRRNPAQLLRGQPTPEFRR
ncbi:MCE family protein [Paracoccus aurantiacus]|uniref:MCE family protein n=1 Tax=Paracoccus aurantiacus TaxID=2599412 RepID=A0A5C6S3P5_9RHOB|nr:MlaD family protein [Paracoccus aurantiacus]TXB69109.1 MCE family protein [Paracoccus aurantiacus]